MDSSRSTKAPPLVERAKAIILSPRTEWVRIAGEEDTTTREVTTGYFAPLALLGPVCGTIGTVLYGSNTLGFGPYAQVYRPSIIGAIGGAAVAFVLTMMSFYFLTIIAHVLAPRFGATEGEARAFKLVAYGSTPMLLVGLTSLWPPLAPLGLFAFYGIHLIYLGAAPMLGMPKEKALPYTVVVVVCAMVLNVIVGALSLANIALLGGMGLI